MKIQKSDGSKESFSSSKLIRSLGKVYSEIGKPMPAIIESMVDKLESRMKTKYGSRSVITTKDVTREVEIMLASVYEIEALHTYAVGRDKDRSAKLIASYLEYQDNYAGSGSASSASATDPNANVRMKTVSSMDAEVYKPMNRQVQRTRMKKKLRELYPEDETLPRDYVHDINSHVVYVNDEANKSCPSPYCAAISTYPIMLDGIGKLDGITDGVPQHPESYIGQVLNCMYLMSGTVKGAVATADLFINLAYYFEKDYGKYWLDDGNTVISTLADGTKKTAKDLIHQVFQIYILGANQPLGNRNAQSGFYNVSYFDKVYFESMFGEYCYPDGTQPEWDAVNWLQREFTNYLNDYRLRTVVTFPVETWALVTDGEKPLDEDTARFVAKMWSKGASFFCYNSTSADSLASCCRLRNELSDNTFSPTSGMVGIETGSAQVLTLNLNRIIQDWYRGLDKSQMVNNLTMTSDGRAIIKHVFRDNKESFFTHLDEILERVYKYHIAYRTILYEVSDAGLLPAFNLGYIELSRLFSTIGLNGFNEAAYFLGMECRYHDKEYIDLIQSITGHIKEMNKAHAVVDKKRPINFNSEVVPAESLGVKNYKWDKADGYVVPTDRNLFNSYFFIQHDPEVSILEKIKLHGADTSANCDGGSACHLNLDSHLSAQQYYQLLLYQIQSGCSYVTYNVPISKCKECGHIVRGPIHECPKCGSKKIDWHTRIIGYLVALSQFDKDRYMEAQRRIYMKKGEQIQVVPTDYGEIIKYDPTLDLEPFCEVGKP